ncbi:MAG: hypothetical protein GX897_07255 [Clostridiales bacterium]|nr:hypothetical protein [Clostridiales bacterium]
MVNYLGNFDFEKLITQHQNIKRKLKRLKKNGNYSDKCCPDQLVGKMVDGDFIEVCRQNIDYQTMSGKNYVNNKLSSPIAIVLESPHRDEFDANGYPIGPAMGSTGTLFFKNFVKAINKSNNINLKSGTYDIVLINSIQYQCSLGENLDKNDDNQKQRDINWILCFIHEDSCDIERRLKALSPFATINLCTKGKGSGLSNLRQLLERKIGSMINYTSGNHPSSWRNQRNTVIN